ncbi:phage capsid protein [Lactobacillus acetotolerans]|uniref:phage capsid protein n=1 Tax=Lactobacillus acetotolerans TaxID=1600 RepID=UPI002FD8ECBE
MAGTENNGLPVRTYQKQFIDLLNAIYGVQAAFTPTFGALQTLDGISNKDVAFSVKTNDIDVVLGAYSTDPNVGVGTGTSNSSRFGNATEVIYKDTDVPYKAPWAFNEAIDVHTVNIDQDAAIADRLELQSRKLTSRLNAEQGEYLASNSVDLGAVGDIVALFDEASKRYTNLEVTASIRAYVSAEVWNAINIDPIVTADKGSAANIDTNYLYNFRGIFLTKVPDKYLGGKAVIFAPDNIGRAFTGIETTRTVVSQDFDGVLLQGAGKGGEFIPDDNLKAVFSATPKV